MNEGQPKTVCKECLTTFDGHQHPCPNRECKNKGRPNAPLLWFVVRDDGKRQIVRQYPDDER